jgi:agmatinase
MQCNHPAQTFLGLPAQTDLTHVEADFACLGVPFGSPYTPQQVFSDVRNAPAAIRARSAQYGRHLGHFDFELGGTFLGETGARIVDCGDLTPSLDPSCNTASAMAAVGMLLGQGVIPIVLGGDDSVPIPCAQAFGPNHRINVLQIDAHIDFRDEVNGVRNGYSSTIRRIREMPWVHRIVQVGARGTGSARPSDVQEARAAGNVIVTAEALHEDGVVAATRHMKDDAPWFIILDVDGLDPTVAPGTSAPVPGGLSYQQARQLVRHASRDCRLAGVVVTEFFPNLDIRDMTALSVVRLLINAIGFAARGGLQPHQ